MENLPEGQETPRRQEKVKKAWKDIRESVIYFRGAGTSWKELGNKDKKKFEKDGKNLRKDLITMKKKKYGKAANTKISNLEEAVIASQTRKKIELEEIRLNVEKMSKSRKGWKDIPEGWKLPEGRKEDRKSMSVTIVHKEKQDDEEYWKRMLNGLSEIDGYECWMTAKRLETTSLDDQRSMVVRHEVETKTEGMHKDKEWLELENARTGY